MKKWLCCILLIVAVLCAACVPGPTGIKGQIKALDRTGLRVRIWELIPQDISASAKVFVEGEVVSTPDIDPDGAFEVHLRPGDYVLKVFSADDELLYNRQVQVKRNHMTRVNVELE